MTPWIIDASLVMNWYLTDEKDRRYSISVFASLGQREILVPALWIYEVSNVLLVAHRRSRISEERIQYILATIMDFNLRLDAATLQSALRLSHLAMKHGLTVYDAAYLDLGLRTGFPIATLYKALILAMNATNVECVAP